MTGDFTTTSARDLMAQTFPPPRWAVPGLISEGLTVLAGAPKLGKSWLCLDLAAGIGGRGQVLGKLDVETGPVLYAALEDTPRRLQSRLRKVLDGGDVPYGLDFTTELPRGRSLDSLERWSDDHPDARLVVVDVLRKITPPAAKGMSAYEADYAAMGQLKRFADDRRLAVVAVHHTRKMPGEDGDPFQEISGSVGITGSADTNIVAKRGREDGTAVLHVQGRDVDADAYGLSWVDLTCTWQIDDRPAVELELTDVQIRIRRAVAENPGIRPREIALRTAIPEGTVKSTVTRLRDAGRLESVNGGYRIAA